MMTSILETKAQMNETLKRRLQGLIDTAGGPTYLAKMLDIPPNKVFGWVTRGRISWEGANLVFTHPTLGESFTATYLRPDLKNGVTRATLGAK